MRKFVSLSQCFLICTTLLISFKSFAEVCPSGGIISSTTCTGANRSGSNAHGIYLNNANDITVNLSGNITTQGVAGFFGIITSGGVGIYLNNDNGSTVNMTGDITTSNGSLVSRSAYGIYLNNANNSTVNMIGNISTSGNNAYGIYLNNANNSTVNMIGNISTSGNNAHGIYLDNVTSSNVNMTGNVTTSNGNARGIYLNNTNGSTVNMTGNVTTSGDGNSLLNLGAYAIYLRNSLSNRNNSVNMLGDVSTTGLNAHGIYLNNGGLFTGSNNTNTVNMLGNVTTNGNNAHGIYLNNGGLLSSGSNNTNTVNMTGNVTTSGNDAQGIYLSNTSDVSNSANTINLTGRISATGLNSNAIFAVNDNATSSNTVQLNRGSTVIGAISGAGTSDYSANNFLKLNLGAGASYSFATTGFTVQDLNGRPMVAGSAYAAGVGNITTASQSLYERTTQITQSLDDRLRTHDAKQNTSQDFWMNTYYSDSNRGGQGLSGSNLIFNQYHSGITAGFNVKNSYTPTELIVNYEHGKLNIDEGNQGITSNSVMAGALFPDIKKLFTGTLSAKAMVGYSDFSGDRKVLTNDVALNGSRNVTASYQSSHLTIGSAWTKTLYQTDKMILDTLVGIDLNTQHINAYSESDLFKWNSRTINQLQERVTLGMEIKPLVKPLTLFGRLGIERRDLISGENQNYAINNTAVSYNDSNQRNTYATLNAGAYYPLTSTVKVYAQVRYYDSVKDIDSLSGSIGISGQF